MKGTARTAKKHHVKAVKLNSNIDDDLLHNL